QCEPDAVADLVTLPALPRRGGSTSGLIGDPELGPRPMGLAIRAHVEDDRARPPGEVEGLLGVHSQVRLHVTVVHHIEQNAVTYPQIIRSEHRARIATTRKMTGPL